MAPNEQGKSSTTKVLLIVLGGGGLLMLLCCGGLFWYGKTMFGKVMITDPAAVKAQAATISDIVIPETYPPMMAMDMSAFGVPMTMCMFGAPGGNSGLMLMQMSGPMAGSQQQMRDEFKKGMQQQGQNQNQQINITEAEVRTYLINDEEYEFEFVKGTRPQDNTAVRQVMGVIPGKGGNAFLMVFDTEANWDEAAIDSMIASLGATLVEKGDEASADGTDSETMPTEETVPAADPESEAATPADATTPPESATDSN